jgi:radical SAM superfamily enzyme YgiQ (UPF0313 family)
MKKDVPHVLLINPWVDDFAAYDFWAKPIGLLLLAGILRMHGYRVSYIDCLDRSHPEVLHPSKAGEFGKGAYLKRRILKPKKLSDVPRYYSRYGIPESLVRKTISQSPRPHVVLVTSLMTYWYPGVVALIELVRETLPEVPVVLGGIYASLCHEHALEHAGADQVISGRGEAVITSLVDRLTGFNSESRVPADDLDAYPYPAFDLQHAIPYVPVLTGRGCPFRCTYCASNFLDPELSRRSPQHVVDEIAYWHNTYSVTDFAFYDDALLIDAENHIMPILEGVLSQGLKVRFHTPNALHIRPLSREVAGLLFRAGFKTIRLGLETAFFDSRHAMDRKLEPDEFERAVDHLKAAGFESQAVGAYLLCGLPEQNLAHLEASIKMVQACGVRPILAQYSPIPHTELWPKAVRSSRYDLDADPVFHNTSIFPCQKEPFSWDRMGYYKALAKRQP